LGAFFVAGLPSCDMLYQAFYQVEKNSIRMRGKLCTKIL
jgi:hypothetical protein